MIQHILLGIVFLMIVGLLVWRHRIMSVDLSEGFTSDFRSEPEYQKQLAIMTAYGSTSDAKRPYTDLSTDMPPAQQNFVNFFALGCRYPSYVGPMNNGYLDADIGVQAAVNAGCRVFVLDIDYLDDCSEAATQYFPRLVVRDIQGKLMIKASGNQPFCNTESTSNIKEVCDKINTYAFGPACQQATDPVVLVLYFQRQPPGSYKSKAVLDYFSHVAKALAPLQDRFITNELDGGTFYRQKQENRLLINNIKDYAGKVLVFSNANTSGFREVPYAVEEDLDYMVHLRLSYTQTKLGITENDAGASYGVLQTAEDFTVIPGDRTDEVAEHTKLRWTICLSRDPGATVSADIYSQITKKFGVHCVPAVLFDPAAAYLFSDSLFKTHGWLPKPLALRYIKPPVVTPARPSPTTDAKGGNLRAPSV